MFPTFQSNNASNLNNLYILLTLTGVNHYIIGEGKNFSKNNNNKNQINRKNNNINF